MENFRIYFLDVFKNNYANFKGRASVKQYWMFVLFYAIILIAGAILDNVLGMTMAGTPYGTCYFIAALALALPQLGLAVRRLHDSNKSGWFMLLAIIPFANLYLIYLLIKGGDFGANKYGEPVK
ncbi:MAG: DUF805 domain-containing protein [Mangrovibacterium sp.]